MALRIAKDVHRAVGGTGRNVESHLRGRLGRSGMHGAMAAQNP
jgi:hypothetical protein